MPRQSDLRFSFSVSSQGGRPLELDVVSFTLREALNTPFLLTLQLSSTSPEIDFARVLEHGATLTIWRGEQAVRYVHGVISSFSQKDSTARRSHYAATVEPLLARADLRSDWRIYQLQTTPTTLAQAVARSGERDIDTHYRREHPPVDYCVQPGETDLHFVNRLCAEYGVYYAYRFDAQGAKLALGDCLYEHGVIPGGPVIYNATPGGDQAIPCLSSFQYTETVRTARQVQTHYDHRHPQYNHRVAQVGRNLAHQANDYEKYSYPGRYVDDDAFGKAKTDARLLGLRGDAQIAAIKGDDARLVPGLAFDLEGHGRESWNRGWRVLSLTHTGTQTTSQEEDGADATVGTHYAVEGNVIPDDVEWRAPSLPRPLIDGPQIATVVGPAGEEVFCNDQGEVRVQFAWDLYGQRDEHSSCWVRVGQGWAGAGYGMLAIPRVGQEVLIAFESGDADTPIIISRLHNSLQPTPYELPRYLTRTVMKTQTVKGQGSNELRFDDLAGNEEIYVHAQKDQNIVINNDETTRIGRDRKENVANDEIIAIGHDRTENVTNDEQVTIGHDRKHTVGQDNTLSITRNHTTTIGKDRVEDVGNQRIDKTGGDHTITTGGHVDHRVQGQLQLQVGQRITYTTKQLVLNLDEFVVNTPGGVLRINAHGAHFQGVAHKVEAGVIDLVDGSGGASMMIDGKPQTSLPIDLTDLFLSR
ncbi:MAG TPA: type VI secretion system tip protein TssI/VgrG [Dyella sp.]|uniref:type VI secretion system Vgr family protein n=1 Tax=Dyella sp. TaxID=1869338 RepID=UPI002B5E38FB|nr:type VI secretion system tip protein TssI/VgrG [Dyella sp.]HTV84060.1 type VI secretion system tip protein TssI/VgrG [Dyella sp.]